MTELEVAHNEGVSHEEYEIVKKENEELKEVLTAVQLDLEARQSDLTYRDTQLRDTNTQLVDAKARIAVSYNVIILIDHNDLYNITRFWKKKMVD